MTRSNRRYRGIVCRFKGIATEVFARRVRGMSNFPWLKLWNEAPDDPKWIAVADLVGCSPQTAFYTFAKAMAYANEHDRRGGSITGLHPQVIASFCRVSLAEISRIFQAFRDLGMLDR